LIIIKKYEDIDEHLGIPGNAKQTVMFKPLTGLFNQSKYLPIRYTPISLELELVDNATDPILGAGAANLVKFTAEVTSLTWQISNVQAKCDLCTLDNALDNSYTEMLLSGKSFPINYNTFVSQIQTITNQSAPYINVSRALTRLKSVFVSLEKDYGATSRDANKSKKF